VAADGSVALNGTMAFDNLVWDKGVVGDVITLRAYTMLVYGYPNAFDLTRTVV
jgi:hypothetical protein